MSFIGFSPKRFRKDELNILHKNILQVAYEVTRKGKILDTLTLFKICCKKLPNPEPEIDQAIRDLHRMKYIVEGKKLVREDILTNETRNKIYDHILENPGTHEREIRDVFGLGAYMAFRHLGFLELFGFIRKKDYKNKSVYFPLYFDEVKEKAALLLRHKTTKLIYEILQEHQELRISELGKIILIPYATIQFHVNLLLKGDLIKKIRKGSISYYIPADLPIQESL